MKKLNIKIVESTYSLPGENLLSVRGMDAHLTSLKKGLGEVGFAAGDSAVVVERLHFDEMLFILQRMAESDSHGSLKLSYLIECARRLTAGAP